jgi:hypothetical protein
MSQTPASYDDALPCPACGCTRLRQFIERGEDIVVTDNGTIENIEPRDFISVKEVWCTKCDEMIWSK